MGCYRLPTRTELDRIEKMTLEGVRQKEIAAALGLHRNTIYRGQKSLGLIAWQTNILPAATKNKILHLLKRGMSRKRVEQMLHVTVTAVRKIAEEHNLSSRNDPLSPEDRVKFEDEILNHRNFGVDLAEKYKIPYKRVLREAHKILNCTHFRPSRVRDLPLSSPFPQRKPRTKSSSPPNPEEQP
jgi:predicted transcriptional regulator